MTRTILDEALVLKAYDVGEADRLCILLTKDHGKIAARARGVRKMKSRFGGSILPLQKITVELNKGSSGYHVSTANCIATNDGCRQSMDAYIQCLMAVTMLSKALPDEEPVPDIFTLTDAFLTHCAGSPHHFFASFALRFLSIQGLLPSMTHSVRTHKTFTATDDIVFSPRYDGLCLFDEDPYGVGISGEIFSYLKHIAAPDFTFPTIDPASSKMIQRIAYSFVGSQLGIELEPLPVAPGTSSKEATPTW